MILNKFDKSILLIICLFVSKFAIGMCIDDLNEVRKSGLKPETKVLFLKKELERKCDKSAEYHLEIFSYYLASKDYINSKKHLDVVYDNFPEHSHQAKLGFANLLTHQNKYDEAEKVYHEIINENPKWMKGYLGIGTMLMLKKEYKDALGFLNKGFLSEGTQKSELHKLSGLAYYYLGNQELSLKHLNSAFNLDRNLILNKTVVIAAARNYVDLGKEDVAKTLLTLLVSNIPDVENDPEFLAAIKYLLGSQ